MPRILNENQKIGLIWLGGLRDNGGWGDPTQGFGYGCTKLRAILSHRQIVMVFHSLVRAGVAEEMQQGEHVRGERPQRWWEFKITDAGRTVLEIK